MSLRVKLVLALVLLSSAATITIGVWNYVGTADRLHTEVDNSLDSSLRQLTDRGPDGPGPAPVGRFTRNDEGFATRSAQYDQVLYQLLDADGDAAVSPSGTPLPVSDADKALAASPARLISHRDVTIGGDPYRMATASIGNSQGAVQAVRSLSETNRVLDSLRNLTLITVVSVVVAAAVIGWLIARQITRRLVRLTGAAEHVAETGNLDVTVPVGGDDEAGRLGTAFNEMLGALARSKDAQQRLVQDAGHELRTPLTSLRTNLSVLRRHDDLPPMTQAKVLDALEDETRELTHLVNELVDLATDRRGEEPEQTVALGALVERVAERARRRTGRIVAVTADDTTVTGRPAALERAVSNLIDNAAKFDAEGGAPIEVSVQAGRVAVCDRGPGIPAADLAHVFDRFFRSVEARSRPGSGLGLAIVRDVVEAHGGTVFADARPGGGACVGFQLPANPRPPT